MKIGLKSVLVGYHAFWLHPFLVAEGWRRIYGFPWDPRLWFAFFVHDLGYAFNCPNMDGVEGEQHPFFGANLMHMLFDDPYSENPARWFHFCLYHSRSLAKVYFAPISKLAYADKLCFFLYPQWLLKLLYRLSGEWEEYRRHNHGVQYGSDGSEITPLDWDEWYHQASLVNIKTLKEINYQWEE
jgi:hypothetical protein